jgi:hypothetical protein
MRSVGAAPVPAHLVQMLILAHDSNNGKVSTCEYIAALHMFPLPCRPMSLAMLWELRMSDLHPLLNSHPHLQHDMIADVIEVMAPETPLSTCCLHRAAVRHTGTGRPVHW